MSSIYINPVPVPAWLALLLICSRNEILYNYFTIYGTKTPVAKFDEIRSRSLCRARLWCFCCTCCLFMLMINAHMNNKKSRQRVNKTQKLSRKSDRTNHTEIGSVTIRRNRIRRNPFRRILKKYIVGVNAVVLRKNRTPYLQLHFSPTFLLL